jgi:glycosyltransferase involved in cell wall biosynthesis
MLMRAVASVLGQTLPAAGFVVVSDITGRGAAFTRNAALRTVRTQWVAFLDDDDEMLPTHLETLLTAALDTGASYVYSWFTDEHSDPLGHFGKLFDPENPVQTTVTTLVRRELAQRAGFRTVPPGKTIHGQKYGEDFQFTLDCLRYGAIVHHVPKRTWRWEWHNGNTSGEPDKWTSGAYAGE